MKIKEFIKSYAIGLIVGIVVSGTISVIAATCFPSNDVTYDNTESGLSSTNVQGAIDELYGVCTAEPPAGETIIENAGLEKDPYECRYFFTGSNPNNYITFNNETAGWRILSVECDGTIKIIRTAIIGNEAWDSSDSNNWARPATLNTYLNVRYYNGLNVTNSLNETAQNQIISKDWSIGPVTFNDSNIANTINNENGAKWNGKVALPTVSEYIRSNSNKNSCGSLSLNNNNYGTCKNTTWMYINDTWWTLSANASLSGSTYTVSAYGNFGLYADVNYTGTAVRPALYLSSEISLTGSGTQSDPYQIK